MKTTTIPPLRIAILGCANIAQQFAIAVAPGKWVRIEAMGNRKADPGIDTVYTPLPNALHAQ